MYLCLTVSFLYAFLLSECLGQVTIGLIPQGPSQCPSGSEGTATLSTVRTLPTGSQIIPAGDFWEQAGAVWTFETGNQGLLFSNLGFGVGPHGAGDIDSSAIKLDPSSTAWTLSVPSGASAVAIVWEADTTAVGSTASETTAAATTWSSGACKASVLTETPLTCGESVQQPLASTKSVCACPSSILLEELSGGDDPCAPYISAQGDLIVPTNACPSPQTGSRRRRDAHLRDPLSPRHPQITTAPETDWRVQARQFKPRADVGSYDLTMIGKIPCADNTIFGPSASIVTTGGSPAQASLCVNNKISMNAAAYSDYNVNSYISSALSAAASANGQAPQQPGVNAASVFANAVGAPTPGYKTSVPTISCSAVANADIGTTLVIQEWLAYNSLIKLSNWFESIVSQLLPASNNALSLSANLATTFYTDNPPSAPWNTILGTIAPIFGALSAGLGGVGAAAASSITGVISSILGETAGAQATVMSAMGNQRFTQAGDIEKFGNDWLQATYKSVTDIYTSLINTNAAASGWTSSDFGNTPTMADGAWLDLQENDATSDSIMDNINKIMSFRMINYLWNASDSFVVYVPYGDGIMLANGKMGSFQQSDCAALQDAWLNCNAPGGAARLFNANNKNALDTDNPKGATANFQVGIKNTATIDPKTIAAGCVASWQKGNFGYDLDTGFPDLAKGSISAADAAAISNTAIGQDTAGLFNLPVCQVKDLRSFPPAVQGTGFKNTFCGCNSGSAIGGAGSQTHFYDIVSKNIQKLVMPFPVRGQNGNCPGNLNPPLF